MYRPERNAEPQKPNQPYPHIHQPHETLSEHENNETFKLYLNGRTSAYNQAINNATDALARAQEVHKRNVTDPHLWALAEGQIEGLKEILQLLKNSLERNQP